MTKVRNIKYTVSDNGWAVSEGVETSEGKLISFCISIDDAVDEELKLAESYPEYFYFDKMPWIKQGVQGKMPLDKLITLADNSPVGAIEIYDLSEKKILAGPLAKEGKSMVYNEIGSFKEFKLPGE